MYRIIIFASLWHFTALEQNCGDTLRRDVQFLNIVEDITLNRLAKASGSSRVPARVEKPVDCAKLHQTEETPFVAIILNRATGRFLCMGSIIDEKHILTAVKCVQTTNYKTLRILVGYFKAWWGRHSYVYYVEKVVKHEYELVILRLTLPIQFSRTIRPIRLLRFEDAKKEGGTGQAEEGGKPAVKPPDKPPSRMKSFKEENGDADKNESHKPAEESGLNIDNDISESKEQSSDSDQDNSEPDSDYKNYENEENEFTDVDSNKNTSESNSKLENSTSTESDEIDSNNRDEETNTEKKGSDGSEEVGNNKQNQANDVNEDDDSEEENENENDEEEYSDDENDNKEFNKFDDTDETKFKLDENINYEEFEYIYEREDKGKDSPENKTFKDWHTKITEVLIVGFPLTNEDVVGDPIPQTLVYGMRPEKLGDKQGKECLKIYEEQPALTSEEDTLKEYRIFCTDGKSKFCWGCLGGPTLFRREKEYLQVGVIIGAKCENKDEPEPYLHARVDYHIKWISKNSYVHFRD